MAIQVTPVQLLRSSVLNKRPISSLLLPGQGAVNTNDVQPGLFFADSTSNKLFKVGPCAVGPDRPNEGAVAPGDLGNTLGELWLDTSGSAPKLRVFDGTSFVFAMPQFSQALLQDTAPFTGDLAPGSMWFDTATGLLYVLYENQWVQTSSATVS
jgi:hypothetical protein